MALAATKGRSADGIGKSCQTLPGCAWRAITVWTTISLAKRPSSWDQAWLHVGALITTAVIAKQLIPVNKPSGMRSWSGKSKPGRSASPSPRALGLSVRSRRSACRQQAVVDYGTRDHVSRWRCPLIAHPAPIFCARMVRSGKSLRALDLPTRRRGGVTVIATAGMIRSRRTHRLDRLPAAVVGDVVNAASGSLPP